MTQDELKQAVARPRDYVAANVPAGGIVGVGTGSTANFFIDELATIKDRIGATVASSEATKKRLEGHGIGARPQRRQRHARLCRWRRRDQRQAGHDQGRRRRADAREDRRRRGRHLRLRLRSDQAGAAPWASSRCRSR